MTQPAPGGATSERLELFGLTEDAPGSWRAALGPELRSPSGVLFGGAGLGAAVEALEHATGRPLAWACVQFLRPVTLPATLALAIDERVRGRRVSHAVVRASVDGESVFTVAAALGERGAHEADAWVSPPDAPAPEECPAQPRRAQSEPRIDDLVELRVARARSGRARAERSPDGRTALWARAPALGSAPSGLAVLGDYLGAGIGQAMGQRVTSASLDNTLRIVRLQPADWVLLDIRIEAVAAGFAHGVAYLWSQAGALLAVASQTATVRAREGNAGG